jgi:hypothetical protein
VKGNQMNTFDFCVRLDQLIIECLKGGNNPQELQLEMINAIESLQDDKDPDGLIQLSKITVDIDNESV